MVQTAQVAEPKTPQQKIAARRLEIARAEYALLLAQDELAEEREKRRVDAEALRRKTVADLDPLAAIARADDLLTQLAGALSDKVQARARLNAARALLEDCKAQTLLSGAIDGKNEAQRSAQLAQALKADPEYQAARVQVDDAERDSDDADAKLTFVNEAIAANRARLRVAAAMLEALRSD